MHNKAFSLIELIVVVTIVGILSAVSVSLYASYTTRAKVATGISVVKAIADDNKKYFSKHGVFGDLEQLGYRNITNNTDSGIPDNLSNYYEPPYVATVGSDPDNSTLINCPNVTIFAYVSNIGGVPFTSTTDTTSDFLLYYNHIYHINKTNTFQTICTYYYVTTTNGVQSMSDADVLPGCINIVLATSDPLQDICAN